MNSLQLHALFGIFNFLIIADVTCRRNARGAYPISIPVSMMSFFLFLYVLFYFFFHSSVIDESFLTKRAYDIHNVKPGIHDECI